MLATVGIDALRFAVTSLRRPISRWNSSANGDVGGVVLVGLVGDGAEPSRVDSGVTLAWVVVARGRRGEWNRHWMIQLPLGRWYRQVPR